MTTLVLPSTPGFVRSRFGLETNTQRFESPLSKTTQRLLLAGARWTLTATLPRMNRNQFAPWQAFFVQLRGSVNTFSGYDPDAKFPRGAATGTPLVNGAGQTGYSLNIDGCTANVTNWMMAGDYFTVNSELKMLTANVNSNGSGQATLSFEPALRGTPSDNAAVTVNNPACSMMLIDDMQAVWGANHRGIYEEMTFSAVEALV